MDKKTSGATPRPYAKPEVVMFGNLTELTKRLGATGMNDGGGGNNKTGA